MWGGLGPGGRVEHGRPRVDVGDFAVDEVEAPRLVHPGVGRDDRERPGEPGDHDRDGGQHVGLWRQPVPGVEVDAEEDRLGEEPDPLDGERQTDDLAVGPHQPRPQDPQLERQDRPGHGPDREQHPHRPPPAAGQHAPRRVPGAIPPPLAEHRQQREADPEAGDDDVPAERDRHLGPRRHQVGRVGRRLGKDLRLDRQWPHPCSFSVARPSPMYPGPAETIQTGTRSSRTGSGRPPGWGGGAECRSRPPPGRTGPS